LKFLQTEGSLINIANIDHLTCLPQYGCLNGQDILTHWSIEIELSGGGCIFVGRFDSESDANTYLNNLITKLGIEIIK